MERGGRIARVMSLSTGAVVGPSVHWKGWLQIGTWTVHL